MRTATVLALAAATAALAKDAGGFQIRYTSYNVSWCVQPRAEDDDGNRRPPQLGDQLIFDDCSNAVEALKRGQIWSWSGPELRFGTNASLCLGLGERVVLAPCRVRQEVDEGEEADGAAGAMAPKVTVAPSLVDWEGLSAEAAASKTKKVAGSHVTGSADEVDEEGEKERKVETKWLWPSKHNLCISKDECISAQHPQDAPATITPALTVMDESWAAPLQFVRPINPHGIDAASAAAAGRVGHNQSGSAQGHKIPPSKDTESGEKTDGENGKTTESNNGLGRFGRIGLPAKALQSDSADKKDSE